MTGETKWKEGPTCGFGSSSHRTVVCPPDGGPDGTPVVPRLGQGVPQTGRRVEVIAVQVLVSLWLTVVDLAVGGVLVDVSPWGRHAGEK